MLSYLVMLGACAVVLLLLVRRRRERLVKSRGMSGVPAPGRGVAGEAATAMEDLARQLIGKDGPLNGRPADQPDHGTGLSRDPK